ncbi:carboxypeptidase-like regulatory domain-containing protein, partial [Pseudoalteromonas ruthenica]
KPDNKISGFFVMISEWLLLTANSYLMQKILLPIFFLFSSHFIFGATISGEILSAKDQKPLPFASVLVKGTTVGVSANAQGKFSIQLEPGEYILVCQNVGYASQEKKIRVSKNN